MNEKLEKLLIELNKCKAELKKYELLYQADGNTTKEEFAELKKHQEKVDGLLLKIDEKKQEIESEKTANSSNIGDGEKKEDAHSKGNLPKPSAYLLRIYRGVTDGVPWAQIDCIRGASAYTIHFYDENCKPIGKGSPRDYVDKVLVKSMVHGLNCGDNISKEQHLINKRTDTGKMNELTITKRGGEYSIFLKDVSKITVENVRLEIAKRKAVKTEDKLPDEETLDGIWEQIIEQSKDCERNPSLDNDRLYRGVLIDFIKTYEGLGEEVKTLWQKAYDEAKAELAIVTVSIEAAEVIEAKVENINEQKKGLSYAIISGKNPDGSLWGRIDFIGEKLVFAHDERLQVVYYTFEDGKYTKEGMSSSFDTDLAKQLAYAADKEGLKPYREHLKDLRTDTEHYSPEAALTDSGNIGKKGPWYIFINVAEDKEEAPAIEVPDWDEFGFTSFEETYSSKCSNRTLSFEENLSLKESMQEALEKQQKLIEELEEFHLTQNDGDSDSETLIEVWKKRKSSMEEKLNNLAFGMCKDVEPPKGTCDTFETAYNKFISDCTANKLPSSLAQKLSADMLSCMKEIEDRLKVLKEEIPKNIKDGGGDASKLKRDSKIADYEDAGKGLPGNFLKQHESHIVELKEKQNKYDEFNTKYKLEIAHKAETGCMPNIDFPVKFAGGSNKFLDKANVKAFLQKEIVPVWERNTSLIILVTGHIGLDKKPEKEEEKDIYGNTALGTTTSWNYTYLDKDGNPIKDKDGNILASYLDEEKTGIPVSLPNVHGDLMLLRAAAIRKILTTEFKVPIGNIEILRGSSKVGADNRKINITFR